MSRRRDTYCLVALTGFGEFASFNGYGADLCSGTVAELERWRKGNEHWSIGVVVDE